MRYPGMVRALVKCVNVAVVGDVEGEEPCPGSDAAYRYRCVLLSSVSSPEPTGVSRILRCRIALCTGEAVSSGDFGDTGSNGEVGDEGLLVRGRRRTVVLSVRKGTSAWTRLVGCSTLGSSELRAAATAPGAVKLSEEQG